MIGQTPSWAIFVVNSRTHGRAVLIRLVRLTNSTDQGLRRRLPVCQGAVMMKGEYCNEEVVILSHARSLCVRPWACVIEHQSFDEVEVL